MSDEVRPMGWTHPMCERCWHEQMGDRLPVRMLTRLPEPERCSWCGWPTYAGIYVRADPATLPDVAEWVAP